MQFKSFRKLMFLLAISVFVLVSGPVHASESFSWTVSVNAGNPTQLIYSVTGEKISGHIFGDAIEGYQVGRHIVFYRVSGARQIYHGWMSPNRRSVSGFFSHQGDNLGIWNGSRN